MKNKIQPGHVLDYTNGTGAAILAGTLVVFGVLFGVAVADIPDGETGAVDLEGVFEFPKASGAITQGAKVYYDATAKNVTTTAASNIAIGGCAEAVLTGALTVKVRLVQGA